MSITPADAQAVWQRFRKAGPPSGFVDSQQALYDQMQALVRGDEWASYRTALTARRDEVAGIAAGLQEQLDGPLKPADAVLIRERRLRCLGRLEGLEEALAMPGALADAAQRIVQTLDTTRLSVG